MNWREASTQWLPSLPVRTMSSGEVALSFLDILSTSAEEELEKDSDCEQ